MVVQLPASELSPLNLPDSLPLWPLCVTVFHPVQLRDHRVPHVRATPVRRCCQLHNKWPLFSAKILQNAPVLGENMATKRPNNKKYAVGRDWAPAGAPPDTSNCKINGQFQYKIIVFQGQFSILSAFSIEQFERNWSLYCNLQYHDFQCPAVKNSKLVAPEVDTCHSLRRMKRR